MKNARLRKPAVSQFAHPRPGQVVLLAPMDQDGPPEPNDPVAKGVKAVRVSWHRVVVEVALHDRPKPMAGLRNRVMHASTELLLDFQHLSSHPLTDRFALHRIAPILVLPADMREPQKIERLGLPFSSLIPVVLGKPPELNPARFVWVQFQPELPQPFPIFRQEAVCFRYMLESDNIIVGVSDDNDIASRALSAPDVHPQVEHVMQIDVRKQRRSHSPYTKGNLGRLSGLAVENRLAVDPAGLECYGEW
jgi:hypothetical protein